MQDVTGSRQEFLATYKRKILEWLPHRRHKLWDDTWGKTRPAPELHSESSAPVGADCSERVRTMRPGEVSVRIDFIQNAELRSPLAVQREYFSSQYVSLLCAVVQWKTVDSTTTSSSSSSSCSAPSEQLHTRTYMFMSDDRKHDGAYAAYCLEHLAKQVQ